MLIKLITILSVFRMIVVPVQFQDKDLERSRAAHERLTESAEAYFNSNFNGSMSFRFTITDPVRVSHIESYYGTNYPDRFDIRLDDMVREAVRTIADGVDLEDFDNDGSGEVDHVMFIVAGKGEDKGEGPDCIYPQTKRLSDSGTPIFIRGKKVDSYSVCSEYFAGIFCHEFGHYLGLPDFYDTDGELSGGNSEGLLNTSLMDNGCKNEDDIPGFNSMEMEILGIGTCRNASNGVNQIRDIETGHEFLRMETGTDGHYLLFEYRKGKGMLVCDVDKSESDAGESETLGKTLNARERWEHNQINCRPDRMCARIIGGGYFTGGRSDFRCLYGETAIKDVKMSDTGVSFTLFSPVKIVKTSCFQDAAIVQWAIDKSVKNAAGIRFRWAREGGVENVEDLPLDRESFTMDGLDPSAAYTFSIEMLLKTGDTVSCSGKFTTKAMVSSLPPYIYLNETDRNNDGSFPEGSLIPLRIANAHDVFKVTWTMDGKEIGTGRSGFYTLTEGILKARIEYTDGRVEFISKKIVIR